MSSLGDLPIASSSILSIKEEVEISETQLQEQIFGEVEVRHINHCIKAKKQSEFINGQYHKKECNPSELKDCETIVKSYECNLRSEEHANSAPIHDDIRPPRKKSYTCSFCTKPCRDRSHLNAHMSSHTGVRPYACEICNKRFSTPSNIRRHMLACEKTRIRFERGDAYSDENTEFQCEKCKMCFMLEDQYRSHLQDNKCKGCASEKPFQCPKCENESFASIELLSRHKAQIHWVPKKNYTCSVCAKPYRWKHQLDVHMNFHTGNQPYACPTCPKRYSHPHSLRHHKLICGEGAKTCFKCTVCEKVCGSRSRLNYHMISHRDEQPFKCELCTKSYKSKYSLSVHKASCSGERKYECILCQNKFNYISHLRKHEKIHLNEHTRYQCHKCKMWFQFEHQYRSHSEDNKCEASSQESRASQENEKCEKQNQARNEIENIETGEKSQSKNAFEKVYKEFIQKQNFHLRSHQQMSST